MEFLRYIILICALYFVEAKYLHLDYQYDEDAKVWLKLHKLKTTWHQARKICNIEGAILASPLTEPLKHAMDAYSKAYRIDRYYVGIHATFSSQIWHSIEGVPLENVVDYINTIQIENNRYKPCAVMEGESLINVECQEIFPYICYKSNNASRDLTSCGTTDTAYQMDKRTGNCYKFHAEPRTWVEAYETCFSEQAYLAIINSKTEAQFLTDIFENHPSNTLNADHPNVMNVGILDWEHDREWYTIHGERLEDGYSSWNKGEPNNADNNEYCGSLYRNGLLNDEPCDKKNVFMCEKDVFVHEEYTTENIYTTESEPSTAESEPDENMYTTESVPSEHTTEPEDSETESEPDENLYTTESVNVIYCDESETSETLSEPEENLYTTESVNVIYCNESETSETLSELEENVHTTESESSKCTTEPEPSESGSEPDENLYTTESENIKYSIEPEPSEIGSETDENLYTTQSEPREIESKLK